jgi:hypothetical protein
VIACEVGKDPKQFRTSRGIRTRDAIFVFIDAVLLPKILSMCQSESPQA